MITHSSTEVKLQLRERWLTSVLRISEGSAHENNNAGIFGTCHTYTGAVYFPKST